MELTGRRVLITGASRGIGRGLAVGFAAAGASVALVARSEGPLLELADELGGSAHPADLADHDVVTSLIARIEDEAGPVDVLVNNAGVSHVKYLLDNTHDEIEEVLRVNALAPMHLCREAIPRMLERGGGHIVNISSMAGVIAPPGLAPYSGSKAALNLFTAGLRQDLRGLPIGTTLVELGSVPTELDDASRGYGPIRELAERSKGRDIVPLEDVVSAVIGAVRDDRRHVRLPRQAAPLAALASAPRRIGRWIFRSVEPRGPAP